ncbi:unnamed protein product [Closterium sp. Naga37s-1]|nr:unnamed protein product [Closterium sp. Naga37s-1]
MRVATFDSEPEVAELSLALEDGVTKNSKKVATKLVERVLKFLEMPSSESDVLKEEVQRDLLVAEKEERWMDVDKLTELKTLVSLASISSEAPITQTFSRLALRLREELGMAVPDNFKCAMTGEVMRDPVTLVETGDTYNRNAIENFFAKGKRVCPKSGKHLKSVELVCNVEIRKGIEESYDALNRKTLDEASRTLRDGMEQRAAEAAAAAEARAAALAAGGEAAEAILAEEAAKAEEERKKEEEKKAAAKKKKKGPEPPPKEEPKEASGGEREEEAVEAMQQLSSQDKKYAAQLAEIGAVVPLVRLVTERGAGPVREGTVTVLRNIASLGEAEATSISDAGGIPPMIHLITHDTADVTPAIQVILELSRFPALRGAVTDAMGVVEMIKLLNWHQEDEKGALLEAVLETYWRDDPYVAIQMASVGMFKPLVVLLEPGGLWVCRKEVRGGGQRDDPYVAIQMASVGMFKPLVVLLEPGGVWVGGLMLRRWGTGIPYVAIQMASVGMFKPSSYCLNQVGVGARGWVAVESDMETRMTMADGVMTWGVNKAHRVSLVQCGVLPPLVALLNDGPPEGKAAAARAIEHLSHTDLNRMALAKAGVIPALVKALARGSAEVKNAAQATLANLAMDDQDLDALDEDGTAVRLITMLRAGPQTNRDYAVRTLECMAKESKSMRAAVMEDDGAVTAIFEVLQESASHFAAGSLRSSALLLLGHLCQEHNAAEMMCAPPEVVKTLATLLARPLPGEEREAIVIVLGTMAGNKQMRPLVRVEEQVFTLMHKFLNLNPGAGPTSSSGPGSSNAASSARLQEAILSGLSKLADPDDIEAQQIVARLGVIHLAVHYLKMGPDVMRIPSAVLLGNLSHSTPKLVDQTSLDRRLGKAMTWKLNFSRSNSRASASTGGTGSGASPVTTGTDKLRSCKVHGGKCSLESTFCLVEGDIVPILLELVRRSENRVAEVCLASVATLLADEGDHERAADLLVKLDVIEAAAGVVGRTKELTKWAVYILEKVFAIKKYRAPKYSQPAVTALGRFMTTATGQGRKTAAETLMRAGRRQQEKRRSPAEYAVQEVVRAETESSGDETVTETVTEKGSAFPRPDSDGQSVGRSELLRAGGAGEGGAEAETEAETEAEAEAGKEEAEEGETASEEGLLKQRTRRKEAKSKLPRDTYEDGNNENEEEGGGDGARGSARERGKGVAGGRGADGEDSEEGESEERESEEEGKRRAADKKRRTEGFDYDDGVEHKGGEDDDDGREERRREEGINEEGVGTEETNKEGSKEERKGGSREGFDYDDGVGDGSGDGGEGKGSKRNGDDDDDGDGDGGELEERTKEEGQKRMKRSAVRYDEEEEEGEEGGGEEGVESGGGKAKGMLKGGESDVGAREEEEEEEEKGKSLESAQQPSNKRKGVESDPGADDEEDEEEKEGKRQGVKKGTEKGASGEENEEEGQEKAREREEEEEEEGDEEGEGEAPTKARKRQEGGGGEGGGRRGAGTGVVFFAHGCTHRATHFWPPHRACPSCLGLPEDMALVQHALKRRLAVIAVSRFSPALPGRNRPSRSLTLLPHLAPSPCSLTVLPHRPPSPPCSHLHYLEGAPPHAPSPSSLALPSGLPPLPHPHPPAFPPVGIPPFHPIPFHLLGYLLSTQSLRSHHLAPAAAAHSPHPPLPFPSPPPSSSLSTCWDTFFPPDRSLDIPPVVQVLTTWRQQHQLPLTLPNFPPQPPFPYPLPLHPHPPAYPPVGIPPSHPNAPWTFLQWYKFSPPGASSTTCAPSLSSHWVPLLAVTSFHY